MRWWRDSVQHHFVNYTDYPFVHLLLHILVVSFSIVLKRNFDENTEPVLEDFLEQGFIYVSFMRRFNAQTL